MADEKQRPGLRARVKAPLRGRRQRSAERALARREGNVAGSAHEALSTKGGPFGGGDIGGGV
jgi:hypothetical protein